MQDSLFEKSLKKIQFVFLCTGMSINGKKRTKKVFFRDRTIFLFNFIWLNSDIVFAIFWFLDGVDSAKITEMTYLMPCTTLSFVATLKSFIHLYYEDEIFKLIDGIKGMKEESEVSDEVNDVEEFDNDIDKMRKEEIRFLDIVVNVLNLFNGLMVMVFTATPLVLVLMKYLRTGEVELMMPFLDVYPFNPLDLRWYPFIYFHQIWSECIVLLQICAADYLFYSCCTFIRIQFQLLQRDIEEVIPNEVTGTENFQVVVGKIVRRHQDLIRAADTLEMIYTRSTLFNFISSSVVICLTGFNVTTITNPAFVFIFLTFLFMSLLQIFFLCFFGDLLMQSSIEVSKAAYNCRWYFIDAATAKDLSLIQIRAQKPCKLTASGFADVNLKAFMTVLSRSWSYFALLKTLYR